MERLLLDIVKALRENPELDGRGLTRIINAHSNRLDGDARFSKKQLMPFYLRVKGTDPQRWRSWDIDPETERLLLRAIQMKPRRTASGVATITVITKPWACSGNCLFCPADVRMPKSYLHAEPACQRAERNWFDPYLQVTSRLNVLSQMGHATDKVELIVLGGTFDDYPEPYRIWFAKELFRGLNDFDASDEQTWNARLSTGITAGETPGSDSCAQRAKRYGAAGIPNEDAPIDARTRDVQAQVTAGDVAFNDAIAHLYRGDAAWRKIESWQQAGMNELLAEHRRNEDAAHRCVGLVMETRPDHVNPANLKLLRRLGCTKVQVGVQTLQPDIVAFNGRAAEGRDIGRTFELLRLHGFKIHAHFMANLPGSTPERDIADYREFATGAAYQPDEVKLYPCVLIDSAPLARRLAETGWEPYREDVLVEVLATNVLATPPFTRISRMIRDFSAGDIVAGNKKTNLRQLVEARLRETDDDVAEIRFREIGTDGVESDQLELRDTCYTTTATEEHFLEWMLPDGRIAGFLRLSLPDAQAVAALGNDAPVGAGEAMIREVHVYGRVARLHAEGAGAQHRGLGRALVQRAAAIARAAGYTKLNVISAVGTRGYYRKLGFTDQPLYQQLSLG